MFHLNVSDDNDDVQAYLTKSTLVVTRVYDAAFHLLSAFHFQCSIDTHFEGD